MTSVHLALTDQTKIYFWQKILLVHVILIEPALIIFMYKKMNTLHLLLKYFELNRPLLIQSEWVT